jgi:rod shape-determining protein MreC
MRGAMQSKYTNIVFILLLIVGFSFIIARLTPSVRLIKNFVYYAAYQNINAANQIFQASGNLAENIKSIVYMRQENLFYKQINWELSDKLRNYEVTLASYKRLIKLLDMPKIRSAKSVFAKIIVREPQEWYQCFIIDKGSSGGLYNGLQVAVPQEDGGLCAVGSIIETYSNSSKVALITNVLSAVPVQIKGKNIGCLAEGSNSNLIKIMYIPVNAAVKPGDEIEASPLSSIFSEGMPIGKIISVSEEQEMHFKTAIAEVFFESDSLY